MSVSENLRKMKSYLEENGWSQGSLYGDYSDAACLVGSYFSVNQSFSAREWVNFPELISIAEYLGIPCVHLPRWNDHPMRTKEEVLETLENVAIKHDSDEYRSTNGLG